MIMNQITKAILGCGALLCLPVMARADIKYTQKMSFGEDGTTASSTTRMVRDGAERSETITTLGKAQMSSISLTICNPKQDIKLDPEAKIYTISAPYDAKNSQGNTTGSNKDKGGEKTGKVVGTYAVQDLGEETVAGFKTRHYMLNQTMEFSGCMGNSTMKNKVEYWVADIKDAIACKNAAGSAEMPNFSTAQCKVAYEIKGDATAYQKVFSGLIMRSKTYDEDGKKVLAVMEITQLSQAKLDEALFTIPADYKKVSEEEFQKAQTAAMMKAMMTGQTAIN